MSNFKGTILTIILSFCAIMSIAQANSGVYAATTLDSTEMLIGDRMTAHFKMVLNDKDRVVSITPSEPFDSLANFEVLNKGEWKNGRVNYYRDIAFTVWDTGLYKIPQLTFTVQFSNGEVQTFQSNPVLLTVKNPKDWDKAMELEPIKDIQKEEWTFTEDVLPILMIVGAVILLAVVGWFLYKKLKNNPDKQAIQRLIIQPPHIVAVEKLAVLKNKNLWQNGETKEYYSELSYILREYLEKQFNIPALESTTDELMSILSKRQLSDNLLENMQDLLQTSDLVKFAKVTPPDNVHDKFWYYASEVVEVTKPKPIEVNENQS
jgi:hypothetical protein